MYLFYTQNDGYLASAEILPTKNFGIWVLRSNPLDFFVANKK